MLLQVQPIVEDVRQKGDAAVKSYTKRFDRVDLETVCVPVEVCQPVRNALRAMAACSKLTNPSMMTSHTGRRLSDGEDQPHSPRNAGAWAIKNLPVMWRATSEGSLKCSSWLQSIPDPELSRESREAFDVAYNNIRRFHEAQQSQPLEVETMPGVKCRRVTRPIG